MIAEVSFSAGLQKAWFVFEASSRIRDQNMTDVFELCHVEVGKRHSRKMCVFESWSGEAKVVF